MNDRRIRARWHPSISSAVWIFVVAVSALGCHRSSHYEIAMDLAAGLQSAMVSVEPTLIDFGAPEARSYLGSGWHHDERNKRTGETFVWSRGRSSEVVFHLGWRRDLTIDFHCRPFQFPGAPIQSIAFDLNEEPIGELDLEPSSSDYRIVLPAAAQLVGRNLLVMRYGRVDSPAAVTEGATDERELAAAWSRLVFEPVDDTPVRAERDAVQMPAGAQADFFLDLAPNSRLQIEACESVAESSNHLELSILGEFEPEVRVISQVCDGGPLSFDLGKGSGLTRLRLTARPGGEVGVPAGIRMRHPEVLSPPVALTEERHLLDDIVQAPGPRPNVLIYLVDALRSDRLGVYGCDRGLSPRLDAMADGGVTFTDVIAQSSWTKAAVASIFTGFWPRSHGVNGPDDRLPEDLQTLPELLQGIGYQTGAVVANAYVGRPFGFARGFDSFEFLEHTEGRSEVIHERVAAWLANRGGTDESPFFLYVHTIDPHAPYAPPSPFLETFASGVRDPTVGRVETVRGLVLGTVEPTADLGRDLRDLYDAEVAANDASFGRLLDELEARGELDNTLVIFTSDHGEAFGEHGSWTHGLDLYNEVLSVPLVMRLPHGVAAGQRVPTTVQHIDLLPTILSRCSIEPQGGLPGARLIDASGVVRVGEDRTVLSYLDYWGKTGAAAHRGGWKLIQPLSADFGSEVELFRHREDRTELQELSSDSVVRSGWLEARLAVALRDRAMGLPTDVDAETREQLKALGYMQ